MSVSKIARKIPEGRVKDVLRSMYHQLSLAQLQLSSSSRNDFDISYSLLKKRFNVVSRKEGFEFQAYLPRTNRMFIDEIPISLPGYLLEGGIENKGIIIDAGAFPGEFSVYAARKKETKKVLALEPDPENREYLHKMIRMNGVSDKVKIMPYALSDRNGKCYMGLGGHGSTIVPEDIDKFQEKALVETITLDSLIGLENIGGEDFFIKMDIEGSEINAMFGAKETLTRGAKFAIASYHDIEGIESNVLLEQIFEKAGYGHKTINERYHKTTISKPK